MVSLSLETMRCLQENQGWLQEKINGNGFSEIGIIKEWVNQNTKESKKSICFIFIPSFFSLSYMWVNSIAWTATIIVCGRIDYKLDS